MIIYHVIEATKVKVNEIVEVIDESGEYVDCDVTVHQAETCEGMLKSRGGPKLIEG